MNLSRLNSHAVLADSPEPVDWLDAVAECVVTALLVFMPAAFGVVAPWSETVVAAGAMTLAVLVAIKHLWRGPGAGGAWAYLPVVLFMLLVVAQLVPLPSTLVGTISPATLATRQRLLADLAGG